jgi:hypothetical protein
LASTAVQTVTSRPPSAHFERHSGTMIADRAPEPLDSGTDWTSDLDETDEATI